MWRGRGTPLHELSLRVSFLVAPFILQVRLSWPDNFFVFYSLSCKFYKNVRKVHYFRCGMDSTKQKAYIDRY